MMAGSHDKHLIRIALKEDIGSGDITTRALGLSGKKGRAVVVAKGYGVISGINQFKYVFKSLSERTNFKTLVKDGDRVKRREKIIEISGPLDTLLIGERTAMNILCHLSGVATLTSKFVERTKDYPVKILDTRKTMPGMRVWEKEAVRHGGGSNHRRGLYDMYLIKENHISAAGNLLDALRKIQRHRKKTGAKIEIEVKNTTELKQILKYKPDFILLDNFSLGKLKKAVELANSADKNIVLEASGNINQKNIGRVASTGVDRISIGALTHSAPALDLSFKILE